MEKVINVLIFEEEEATFQYLKRRCLAWAPNCLITRADGRKTLETRLKWMSYNLVIAGYCQPTFSAIDLLFYLKDVHAHCPLVFILDASQEYNSADTAIMKHAAACVYMVDFHRKSFLMEEVILRSMPQLSLRLANERVTLEAVIRKGRAKFDCEEDQRMITFYNTSDGHQAVRSLQPPERAGQHDSLVPPIGHQDSDTTTAGGESPVHQ